MEFVSRYRDQTVGLLRIAAGLLFLQHGVQKLFGGLGGFGGQPGNTAELFSLMGLAGVLETFGAMLLVLGLLTRPVAFLLSGMMAVAYFMAHMPNAFFPIENGGELAALYSFVFLFFAANGPGAFSLDGFRAREGSVAKVREAAVAR